MFRMGIHNKSGKSSIWFCLPTRTNMESFCLLLLQLLLHNTYMPMYSNVHFFFSLYWIVKLWWYKVLTSIHKEILHDSESQLTFIVLIFVLLLALLTFWSHLGTITNLFHNSQSSIDSGSSSILLYLTLVNQYICSR